MADEKEILNQLKDIRIDIRFIKEHMVDVDTILTDEEKKELDESIEEYKQGKTISLGQLEKEISAIRKS